MGFEHFPLSQLSCFTQNLICLNSLNHIGEGDAPDVTYTEGNRVIIQVYEEPTPAPLASATSLEETEASVVGQTLRL